MKRQDFLKRLYKKKALQLIHPSVEMKAAYLEKSRSYCSSEKLLFEHDRFEESVSMAYYSMYYSVIALFSATGIKCENHTAAILLLSDLFGIDNTAISEAKAERVDKQYYVATAPVRSDAGALIRTAESFNATMLDVIERLNNETIEHCRSAFNKMVA